MNPHALRIQHVKIHIKDMNAHVTQATPTTDLSAMTWMNVPLKLHATYTPTAQTQKEVSFAHAAAVTPGLEPLVTVKT